MLWWLAAELLIAAVIVGIACRMRRYWLGGALVFLLWPLFCWLAPAQHSEIFACAFIFGLPTIILLRGRALLPEEKARLAEKYAHLNEHCPIAAFIFGVLSIVMLLWMASSWEIYDLSDGQLSVERRTWWGLSVKRQAWPANQVVEVKVKLRQKQMRGTLLPVKDIIFLGTDGIRLFRSARSILSADDYARRMNDELKKLNQGSFHEWALVNLENWHWSFCFFVLTWLFGRGLGSRWGARKRPRSRLSSHNGISLDCVLMRAEKK